MNHRKQEQIETRECLVREEQRKREKTLTHSNHCRKKKRPPGILTERATSIVVDRGIDRESAMRKWIR